MPPRSCYSSQPCSDPEPTPVLPASARQPQRLLYDTIRQSSAARGGCKGSREPKDAARRHFTMHTQPQVYPLIRPRRGPRPTSLTSCSFWLLLCAHSDHHRLAPCEASVFRAIVWFIPSQSRAYIKYEARCHYFGSSYAYTRIHNFCLHVWPSKGSPARSSSASCSRRRASCTRTWPRTPQSP